MKIWSNPFKYHESDGNNAVDESARLNNEIWKDASEPVFSLRRYVGSSDIFDKRELHNQLLFFTTAGWKGTVEHKRSCDYVRDMADLKGNFVFGADYTLPVHFGLLSNRFVLDKKNDETTSPIAFAQNYKSVWVGAGSNQICDLDKIQAMRSDTMKPELQGDGYSEYIVSMDVARSESKSNNKSAYVVGKIIRNKKTGNVAKVEIVNIVVLPNGHTFREQTLVLKELQMKYNAKVCVVDTSGIGKAIQDECLHEHVDFSKGVSYEAWDSMNVDTLTPDVEGAKKMMYCINASGINHDIILNFWDYVENAKLSFLSNARNAKINLKNLSEQNKIDIINAHTNTDSLLDELANLQAVETGTNKRFTVKQITKRIDKDIYSALVYLLYYVQNFENNKKERTETYEDFIFYSLKNSRRR